MKYRKKPVVVEAFRLGYDDIPEWFLNRPNIYFEEDPEWGLRAFMVCRGDNLKGFEGDYIIRGTRNEVYPCPKRTFEEVYEEVTE
ncbi:MAG: hypothetical protein ACRCWQ_13740 [Bacilli bacterium]